MRLARTAGQGAKTHDDDEVAQGPYMANEWLPSEATVEQLMFMYMEACEAYFVHKGTDEWQKQASRRHQFFYLHFPTLPISERTDMNLLEHLEDTAV